MIKLKPPENKIDAASSILSYILCVFLCLMWIYLLFKLFGMFRGKKRFEPITWRSIGKMMLVVGVAVPPIIGFYYLPGIIVKVSWKSLFLWAPSSTPVAVILMLSTLGTSYLIYFLSELFPDPNKYRNTIPLVMVLNTVSALVGIGIMPIYYGSIFSDIPIGYLLFYFGLTLGTTILFNKISQTKMIFFSNNLTLDMKIDLINKILATKYQRFERLTDGRVFTTLNSDLGVLAGTVNLFMGFVSNLIRTLAGLIYLFSISFGATFTVLLFSIALGIYYYLVSLKAKVFMEESRTAQNIYMSLLNSLLKGYKELSIHRNKKIEYREDLVGSCETIREKSILSSLKFLNSKIIGGALTSMVIGGFCILVPRLLEDVNKFEIITFIMVIFFVRGPIQGLMGVLPGLTGIRVAWGRVKEFNEDIGSIGSYYSVYNFIKDLDKPGKKSFRFIKRLEYHKKTIEKLEVEDVQFKYNTPHKEEQFEVGPVSFELNKGEILFITGGNGSGKTTLVKLLAGLYTADKGKIKIDGQVLKQNQLGENYSAIFSDYHLFQKLYTIDVKEKEGEMKKYLRILEMENKVHIDEDSFSTTNLSGGQRKRLALFQCYLEDCPIYLFDELAADQDPGFRQFIYRDLFQRMKEEGKIIIACTHDDHYFDAADKIIKMDMGKIDDFEVRNTG
jgi:putative ATP-binding cassette transporter